MVDEKFDKKKFESYLQQINEIIIQCEKTEKERAKEFSTKIKEKLKKIFKRYASEIHFDSGLDTSNPNFEITQIHNLAKALYSGNKKNKEYAYSLFKDITKLLNKIQTNLPK